MPELAWVMAKAGRPRVMGDLRDITVERMRRVDPALVHGLARDLPWAFRMQQVPFAVGRVAAVVRRLRASGASGPGALSLAAVAASFTPVVNGVRMHLGDGKPMDSESVRAAILRHVPRARPRPTVIDLTARALRPASQAGSASAPAPTTDPAPVAPPWHRRAKYETSKVPDSSGISRIALRPRLGRF